VHKLQAQAVQRPDPLHANLGVLTGDVLAVTYCLGECLKTRLPNLDANGSPSEAFFREADLYLRCVRQTDRLMHMEQQREPVKE